MKQGHHNSIEFILGSYVLDRCQGISIMETSDCYHSIGEAVERKRVKEKLQRFSFSSKERRGILVTRDNWRGLVSALFDVKEFEARWIGWAGVNVLDEAGQRALTKAFAEKFAAYKRANQMFVDVVNEIYEEGDVVWCHDYYLMFLPKCLKDYNSQMKVGWFLHTPFPSSEIHRTLSSRSELLRAVLAADLVG
ncbi:hypothetical protein FXO38_05886 [Capsicum annuum]|nr:hypothetical protein FXO38_05886 [Capsicum annuum]KAF3675553.1 hypothetical protein FXO37_05801 [Capsicum annuum]